jgi:hypothetical protein
MRPHMPKWFLACKHATVTDCTAPRGAASALLLSVSRYQRWKRLRTLHEYMYVWGRYACIISSSLLQKCRQGGHEHVTQLQFTVPSYSSPDTCFFSVSVTKAFAPQIRNTVSVTRPSTPSVFTKQWLAY